MANLKKIIQDIGLSEKEARVYLANLEVGEAKVSVIAKKCSLNRVTTYDILKRLLNKGLASLVIKDKQKVYYSIEPKQFLAKTKERVKNLEKVLPILKKLSSKTAHPKIEYFEGLEGIKHVYQDTLNSQTEILNYANSRLIREIWPEYDEQYVAKRVKKKIFLRGIAPYDESGVTVASENKKSLRDIKLVPRAIAGSSTGEAFDFSNEINIYDNKVSIISLKHNLIGIIIENEDIANTQRSIFKMAWEFVKIIN